MNFKQRLRQFIAPDYLFPQERSFVTLDQNGGLVVDVDGLIKSGRFDRQFEGLERLRMLNKEQSRLDLAKGNATHADPNIRS